MPKKRSWTKQELRNAVYESKNTRQVIQRLGLVEAGGNYAQIKKYIRELGIETGHFTGMVWNKGKKYPWKKQIPIHDVLVKGSFYQSHKLRQRLFVLGIKYPACEECGWAKVSPDGRLPLELDHINGERTDHRLENLRILCPNCHSLKPTHRRKKTRDWNKEFPLTNS